MTAEKFWNLLAKKLSGEAADEELVELTLFLEANNSWKQKAEILNSLWQQSPYSDDPASQKSFDWHLGRMINSGVEIDTLYRGETVDEKNLRRKFFSKKWSWIAAATVIAGALIVLGFKYFSDQPTTVISSSSISTVTTRAGSRMQLKLPDGSKVFINSSSNLSYDKDFGKKLREVTLEGEAYFDVVKDPEHPFIIHTKVVDVKVLGTEFNVKAYPEDKVTETSLIRGSVELTVKNRNNEKIHLKPNEKSVVSNSTVVNEEPATPSKFHIQPKKEILSVQQITFDRIDSSVIETSWVQNKLVFQENETFKEVALKMERWYGVHISFENEQLANTHIYGSFTTETISEALQALKEGFKFNYKINGNEIIISP